MKSESQAMVPSYSERQWGLEKNKMTNERKGHNPHIAVV